jgi:lipoprotein NlpI
MYERVEENPRVEEVIRQAIDADEHNDNAFAEMIMTQLAVEFPRLAIVHAYLGWVFSRAEKHRTAIEQARLAIQLDPTSERVSMMLFRVLWSAKEYVLAQEEMKRFVAVGHSEEYARMLEEWQQISAD